MIRALLLSATLLSPTNGVKAGFTLLPGANGPAPQANIAMGDAALAPVASTTPMVSNDVMGVKPLSPPQQNSTPQNMVLAAPVNPISAKLSAPTPDFTPVAIPATPTQLFQQKTTTTTTTARSTVMPLSDTPNSGVVGFGKRVPLVIALNELAPMGSQQAFGKNVNPQMPIDWQGGQDWLTTLNQALAPKGLKASYAGQTVFVESAQARVVNAALDGSNGTVMLAPISEPPTNYNQAAPPAPTSSSTNSTVYNQNAGRDIPNPDNSTIISQSGNNGLPMLDPVAKLPPPAPPMGSMPVNNMGNMPVNNMPTAITTTTQTVATTSQTMPAPIPLTQPQPVNLQMNNMATMPTMAAPMSAAAPPSQQWSASKGTTLRHVLEEWAARNGTELVWNTEYDFPVQAGVNINGGFEEAVRTLLRGFNQATPQPVAIMHKATAENTAVLVVSARGNDYGGDDN